MLNHEYNACRIALACSITLHAGLAAWTAWPRSLADIPPQQVVEVSVVAISSPTPQETEGTANPLTLQIPPALPQQQAKIPLPSEHPKQTSKKEVHKTEPKAEKSVASALSTTGPQSPKTTQTVAAITQPVFNAISLHNTPPEYPQSARNRGIEGNVMLEVNVTAEGTARDVTVVHSSGYSLLDRAAHDAICHWHFVPAQRGNEIVEAKVTVPVEFRLE